MAQQGELIEWNDERGFGFIRPDDGGGRLFVHVSQIGRIATRPSIGDRVSFAVGPGRDGKTAAIKVTIAGANPVKARASALALARRIDSDVVAPRHGRARVYVGLVLLVMLILGWLTGSIPLALVGLYLVMGLTSAGFYYWDKRSAAAGTWRVSEHTLHGLDLAFGIIGGLLAQQVFRHKTAKHRFAVVTYVIAAVHILLLAGLLSGRISLGALADLIPR